jgi:hypothetical protein
MNKTKKKLSLNKATVANLVHSNLFKIRGGAADPDDTKDGGGITYTWSCLTICNQATCQATCQGTCGCPVYDPTIEGPC